MASSLKVQNTIGLYGLMAGNLIVFYAILKGQLLLAGYWILAIQDICQVLPAGLGLVLTGMLNAKFSADTKARIVSRALSSKGVRRGVKV
jgi:hypothetical protein